LICSQLANRDFRVTDIHLTPYRDLLLESNSGNWFLESPFRTPVEAEGCLRLERVPLGTHLLFDGATGSCFFLFVEARTELLSLR
jgi:hypothetical protein